MITLVIDEYDKALQHYVSDLGFTLVEDTPLGEGKRWVVVSPGDSGARILLAKATTPSQISAIGNPTGGRVSFFIYTDDFQSTYQSLKSHNVEFTESPRSETFGQVVVFKDLYGNKWDLIERAVEN